jgi:hypothetical protein
VNIVKNIFISVLRVASTVYYRSKLYWCQIQSRFRRLVRKGKRNDIVIYTALFGGYDSLKEPPADIDNCDFICFTDDLSLRSDIYNIRFTRPISECSNRSAKIFKLLPHKYFSEYSYSIWIDGSITLRGEMVSKLVTHYLNDNNFAVFRHNRRNCLYEEMEVCVQSGKDNIPVMRRQIDRYHDSGYPENNGLAACTVLVRKHNALDVRAFDDLWYSEVKSGSKRDQLSFNYVEWKTGLRIKYIDKISKDNIFFCINKHSKLGEPNRNILSRLADKLSG